MPTRLLAICLAFLAAAVPASAGPKAVIELFTSQGCSSCPPADALLGELAGEPGIIAVTMPVTIWDYLGWTDTLASPEMTERQIAYSIVRGDRQVYTPQVVINGREAVVGSDRRAIMRAVRRHNSDRLALPVPIRIAQRDGALYVDVGEAPDARYRKASIWLMYIDGEISVPIRRGENSGRRITYHNVVREIRPIGMWKGKPVSLELPLSDVDKNRKAGCIVILQVRTPKGPGPIIGAAELRSLFPAGTVPVPTASAR